MRGVLQRIERAAHPPYHRLTPLEARVEALTFEAREGHPLRARLYAPDRSIAPVLLYLHGGGFTIGGLETHDSLCRQLALRSGAAVPG